eukprot:11211529-Lingulodinium_polyedra.AAC.1
MQAPRAQGPRPRRLRWPPCKRATPSCCSQPLGRRAVEPPPQESASAARAVPTQRAPTPNA